MSTSSKGFETAIMIKWFIRRGITQLVCFEKAIIILKYEQLDILINEVLEKRGERVWEGRREIQRNNVLCININ
jgi:hypothetical protein